MSDTLAILDEATQAELRWYAAAAEYFRGNLPRSLNQDAGRITAQFLAAYWQRRQLGVIERRLEILGARVELAIQQGGRIVTEVDDLNVAVGRLTTAVADGATELRRLAQVIIDNAADSAAVEAAAQSINAQADALEAAVAEQPEVPTP